MSSELFDAGLAMRKQVLGEQHVNTAIAAATEFDRPLQELVTEYCWGAIWTRPGLTLKTRSLLNVGMLSALGQQHELGVHIRGALHNGATPDEIRETLLQVAVYCGVPAAMDAFRTAKTILEEVATSTQPETGPES